MDQSVRRINKNFFLLTIFGVAMGFLEAIVVVYLRELCYPQGFTFPLSPMPSNILVVELLREISTIVMLVSIGLITGENFLQKLSYFLYSFGVWDIFYYVALKLLLNWPPSLMTWDILFLIPVAWVSPVLAPIICSLTMIVMSGVIVWLQGKGYGIKIKSLEWILLIGGAFIIFCTFIQDFSRIIIKGGFLSSFFTLVNNQCFWEVVSQYKPSNFNWCLFCVGEFFILLTLFIVFRRAKSASYKN